MVYVRMKCNGWELGGRNWLRQSRDWIIDSNHPTATRPSTIFPFFSPLSSCCCVCFCWPRFRLYPIFLFSRILFTVSISAAGLRVPLLPINSTLPSAISYSYVSSLYTGYIYKGFIYVNTPISSLSRQFSSQRQIVITVFFKEAGKR